MPSLRRSDLDAALAFLAAASDVDGPEPFTTELLDRLLELVPCDAATYMEIDLVSGVVGAYVPCSAERPTPDENVPWTLSAEDRDGIRRSPTRAWRRRAGRPTGVAMCSDAVDRRRRVQYQRERGVVDHACLALMPSDARAVWLTFDSMGRHFTKRDRELIELLEPHLRSRIRISRLRSRLDSVTAVLEATDEAPPVVLAERDGEIAFVSPAARRLLEAYFGEIGGRLPQPLADHKNGDPRRFTAVRNGTRLLVEGVGDGSLVLREEPNVSLTRRERDVLRCIAAGKTTAETAQLLWVTEATVSKHLEHVYRKLGVTSRTAALAKLGVAYE